MGLLRRRGPDPAERRRATRVAEHGAGIEGYGSIGAAWPPVASAPDGGRRGDGASAMLPYGPRRFMSRPASNPSLRASLASWGRLAAGLALLVLAELRADFLATELRRLPFCGSALGETDLAAGPEKVRPPRLAANVTGAAFVVPSRLQEVGGVKIGIFGVADPAVVRPLGLSAEDPS